MVDASSLYTGHALVGGRRRIWCTSTRSDPAAAETDRHDRFFLGVDTDDAPYFAAIGRASRCAGRPGGHAAGGRARARSTVGERAGHRDRAGELARPASVLGGERCRRRRSPTAGWTRVDGTGNQQWPRTDPAVIMLVHDGVAGEGGRCLLGHNAAWVPPTGSDSVATPAWPVSWSRVSRPRPRWRARCFEEVGVRVTDVRYVASQPWPYPGSLMLGFFAQADPAVPLRLDPERDRGGAVVHARRDPEGARLDGLGRTVGVEPGLPMASSIAHRLIGAVGSCLSRGLDSQVAGEVGRSG